MDEHSATVKQVKLVEIIERDRNIKYTGKKWESNDVNNFLNTYAVQPNGKTRAENPATQKMIDFVHKLEEKGSPKYEGDYSFGSVKLYLDQFSHNSNSNKQENKATEKMISFLHLIESKNGNPKYEGDYSFNSVAEYINKYNVPSQKQIEFAKIIAATLNIKIPEINNTKELKIFIDSNIESFKACHSKSTIPENYVNQQTAMPVEISQKQKKFILEIERVIGTKFKGKTAKEASDFINENKDSFFLMKDNR